MHAINSSPIGQSCQDVAQIQQVAAADRLAWLNDDDSNDLTGYPGPSWDTDRYEPSPEAEAQESGYRLGYSLDMTARPPGELCSLHRLVWLMGYRDGVAQRRSDDAERATYEADLAEWLDRPEVRDPSEVVRSIGCVAARAEGGVR